MDAQIFYQNQKAGILKQTDQGYEFAYDLDYLKSSKSLPISLTLPLQSEKYKSKELFPFFLGLLPEGWLLGMTTRTLNLSPLDKFNLLLHTGGNTVGAVSVRPLKNS